MISLSASEPTKDEKNSGGHLVGGVFSMRTGRQGRDAAPKPAKKVHTFVDNSARTDLAVSVQHLSITYRTTF